MIILRISSTPGDHWAKDAIDFVSARGLVNGMNDSIYAPNASTTRAQLWTILARQNNADLDRRRDLVRERPELGQGEGHFRRHEPQRHHQPRPDGHHAVAAAVGPSPRRAVRPAASADVPADSYYADAVAWAVENGITAGVGGGRFDPNATCTRGQIATFLYRLYLSR